MIYEKVQKVKSLISKRMEYAELEKHGGSHPQTKEVWRELVNVFAMDEDDAINIIDLLSEVEIYWLSEVFEDISEKLQSEKFSSYLHLKQY